MIAVDTNVVLRYILGDDKDQYLLAVKLFNGKKKILIVDSVLVEMTHTLIGKRYNFSKDDLIKAVSLLFEESNVVFEDGGVVWVALHRYQDSTLVKVGKKKKDIGFVDLLILEKSKYICSIHFSEKFEKLYSFDIAAHQIKDIVNP